MDFQGLPLAVCDTFPHWLSGHDWGAGTVGRCERWVPLRGGGAAGGYAVAAVAHTLKSPSWSSG